jgi:hypothetical protein
MIATNRPVMMDPVNIKRRKYWRKTYSNPTKRARIRAQARARYKADPERFRRYVQGWQSKNPNYIKEYSHEKYLSGKHHDSNANRTPEMIRAHNLSKDIPMTKYCELCPPEDLHLSQMRHHPDYNYPTIFVSTCRACHTAVHRALEKVEEPTPATITTLLNFVEVSV